MRQVIVSLEEAAAAADGQHPALARVLFDLHPHSPYELSLRKVRLLVNRVSLVAQ